jgi:uncharacterized pyridoxamine 5'-phosphate oxidase family protein
MGAACAEGEMKKPYVAALVLSVALNLFLACRLVPFGGNAGFRNKEEKMENTDKVVKFLQDAKVFYIATIDGQQARVRPFGVALNIGGKLSICTGAWKNVARQIKANPNVEISAMTADGKYIRVSGPLADVSNDANRRKFFDFMPSLAELYKGKESEFQVLSFEKATATIADMSGHSEVIELE